VDDMSDTFVQADYLIKKIPSTKTKVFILNGKYRLPDKIMAL
jgi:hypothetical protein